MSLRTISRLAPGAVALFLLGCPPSPPVTPAPKGGAAGTGTPAAGGNDETKALADRCKMLFGIIGKGAEAESAKHEVTDDKVALGRQLYYDERLSKGQKISCNTCHDLAKYGVDNKPVSTGHKAQTGTRNSPTVYNAAWHLQGQFWDWRAVDVEEQSQKPITNPVEMACVDEDYVVKVLRSIPGYAPLFKTAFPDDKGDPVTMKNLGEAIGAFERRLVTPSRMDDFMGGKLDALSADELAGLKVYLEVNCQMCHMGPAFGGNMAQKLGLKKPWPTTSTDQGRFEVTKSDADKLMFKVPSLRNIHETGPYLHDGSEPSLEKITKEMADYQLGVTLDDAKLKSLLAFLKSLTGTIDQAYIKRPELPPSGPETPAPDEN